MNGIKVGEFVRVENVNGNVIAKIIKYLGRDGGYKDPKMYLLDRCVQHGWDYIASNEIYESDIIKHSKNIIDVLEVGDIVNSRKVEKIFIDPFTKKKRLQVEGTEINWQGDMSTIYIEEEDINSILTHEQYESNCYRLEE